MFSSTKIMMGHKPKWSLMGQKIYGDSDRSALGMKVAVSGDGNVMATIKSEDDFGNGGPGAIRVYAWNGSAWTRRGQDLPEGSDFSLNHSGNRLVLSKTLVPFSGESGRVSAYDWNGNSWIQVGSDLIIQPTDGIVLLNCGLDDAGDTLVLGFFDAQDGFAENERALIRAYDLSNQVWNQVGSDMIGELSADFRGQGRSYHRVDCAISGDGNVLAHLTTEGIAVKTRNGSSWNARPTISIILPTPRKNMSFFPCYHRLGLSENGNILVVGIEDLRPLPEAPLEPSKRGEVKVFQWADGAWTSRGQTILIIDESPAPDGPFQDIEMSSDGKFISIGIPSHGNDQPVVGGSHTGTGKVISFELVGNSWTQRQEIHAEEAFERCGESISLSNDGKTLVVGSPWNDYSGETSGLVRVFRHA